MYPLALTATEAAAWAGLITAAVTATGGVIVAVIGAIKGGRVIGKVEVLGDRTNSQANHLQSVERQITGLARDIVPTGPPKSIDLIDDAE